MKIKKTLWIILFCGMFFMMPTKVLAQEVIVSEESEYLSMEDAISTLREKMVKRESEILLNVQTESYQEDTFYYDILLRAMEHTGNPVEGDYLRYHTSQVRVNTYCETVDEMNYVTLKYTISYFSSAEQEAAIDAVFEEVMANLNITEGTDYQKVKSIYDYITSNIIYDYENKDNASYTIKHSAYAALIDKCCVCQGYANLFYRMALTAGIDCRIIDGISHGESHAWNIICIDDNYYNVDCTWDAELSQMGFQYQYFLKGDIGFEDHARNDDYMTDAFVAKYPIAQMDYIKDNYWISYAASEFAGGMGTEEFPYQISTPQELALMAYKINNDNSQAMYAYYQLTNDIDLSGHEWIPILDFYGTLDGQGYTISNMSIQYLDDYMCYGLIGYAEQALVKNLCIENSVIDVTERNNSDEGFYVYTIGMLLGKGMDCQIENCLVEGNVNFNVALYGTYLGGLLGCATNVSVYNSHASVEIDVISEQCAEIGGLIGKVEKAEIYQSSYKGNIDMYVNNGTPSSDSGWVAAVGGVIGGISWNSVTMSDCYAIVNADFEATRHLVMGGAFGYVNLTWGKGETITLKNVYTVSEMNGTSMNGSIVSHTLFDSYENMANVSGFFPSTQMSIEDCGYFIDDNFYAYENVNVGQYVNRNNITEYFDARKNIVTLFTEKMTYDTSVWRLIDNEYPKLWGERLVADNNPFMDIEKTDFFYAPVLWAVKNGITNGYGSDTIFNPEGTCTRGQIVTFLWRANGSPEPSSLENPFTDVPSSEYYYKAVLWAVENGITAGYGSDTIFNPDGACTRAQVATFMWRAAGKPDMSGAVNPFTDLEEGSFYYDAVLWAVENGITNGYGSAETFCPEITCTRGQIVTFLYRGMQGE